MGIGIIVILGILVVFLGLLSSFSSKRFGFFIETAKVFFFIAVVLLIGSLFSLIEVNDYNDAKYESYKAFQEMVNDQRDQDRSVMERRGIAIKMSEINDDIAKHRVRKNSWYVGAWYSEKIANMGYLK